MSLLLAALLAAAPAAAADLCANITPDSISDGGAWYKPAQTQTLKLPYGTLSACTYLKGGTGAPGYTSVYYFAGEKPVRIVGASPLAAKRQDPAKREPALFGTQPFTFFLLDADRGLIGVERRFPAPAARWDDVLEVYRLDGETIALARTFRRGENADETGRTTWTSAMTQTDSGAVAVVETATSEGADLGSGVRERSSERVVWRWEDGEFKESERSETKTLSGAKGALRETFSGKVYASPRAENAEKLEDTAVELLERSCRPDSADGEACAVMVRVRWKGGEGWVRAKDLPTYGAVLGRP